MIPLHDTEFDFASIDEHIIGAGIIPVSVDEHGTCRLLLGKERYINHWRGSLKWSGFEGGRKSGEAIEQTAAREFIEESIGVVSIDGASPTIESVVRFVRDHKYIARIVLCIVHGDQPPESRYHVTYLVQVPYDTDYVTRFVGRRRSVVELQHHQNQITRLLDDLKALNVPLEDSSVLAVVNVCDEGATAEILTNDGETRVLHLGELSDAERTSYTRWYRMRQAFTAECDSLEKVCPHMIKTSRNACNQVTTALVNEDYIEKQYVQWWSIDELRTVLNNGGFINAEFFRAYFLPVLQRSLQELEDASISTLDHEFSEYVRIQPAPIET